MTPSKALATEARNLRAVCARTLPRVRSIVDAHPDQARPAFDVLAALVDQILAVIEAHPEAASRDDPAHRDAETALSEMIGELRRLADAMTPE
jgi:hypothetical protein